MAVRDYFERMGLDVCNLQATGMGGKDPVPSPREKNAGEINRRVEFQIME
jgi:outer membrane protein OmpA-like peptidoglycan-associated protein